MIHRIAYGACLTALISLLSSAPTAHAQRVVVSEWAGQAPQGEFIPRSPNVIHPTEQTQRLASTEMRLVHRPKLGMVIGGIVVFAASYVANIFGAGLGSLLFDSRRGFLRAEEAWGVSFIPVVGPIIFGFAAIDNQSGNEWQAGFAFVDAAVQLLGITIFAIGLAGEDVYQPGPAGQTTIAVLPSISPTNLGVRMLGTF